jgi:hypothetical protein
MSKLRETDLGVSRGECANCHAYTELRLKDSRFVRTASDLLKRRFDAHPQRTATCAACGATYPIRQRDRTAMPAAHRGESPRTSREGGRDWRDTGSTGAPVQAKAHGLSG